MTNWNFTFMSFFKIYSVTLYIITFCVFLSACSSTESKDSATDFNPSAVTYHVSKQGNDANSGQKTAPFLTVSKAAEIAMPGDTILVHKGIYRERIDPPRGGVNNQTRITYQAAADEKVVLLGSEKVKGWTNVKNDVWKVTLPNHFFGNYNPYQSKIAGDWFIDNGRNHHTGAVYVKGHWLWEAPDLATVLGEPFDINQALREAQIKGKGNLFNLKLFSVGESKIFQATEAAAQSDITLTKDNRENTVATDIKDGDWQKFEDIDFTTDNDFIRFYAGAANTESQGGIVDVHLDSIDGKIISSVLIRPTEAWSDLRIFTNKLNKVTGVHDLFLVYRKPTDKDLQAQFSNIAKENQKLKGHALWYATVDQQKTTIYAQFNDLNPNQDGIEINTRESIFYPSKTGINYITVNGFDMRNAATNWAPPTAEQVAAIGTHWSKGWIIENNNISYARSSCLSVGKYGDEFDNTSADAAVGYVDTIERALNDGWNKDNIGHHVINKNNISYCEQAGIVGSMGGAFSKITNNTVHDIHRQKLFKGYEMAGIKLHAPVDTEISGNIIYNTIRGVWLDWMTQGSRISNNLFYNNDDQDLLLEVNHGPALIDNNIFLSNEAISDWSQGSAFVHNLIAGKIFARPVPERDTPILEVNSTAIKSMQGITGGDNRYLNNVFIQSDLTPYQSGSKNQQAYNVFIDSSISFDKTHKTLAFTQTQIDTIKEQFVPVIDTAFLGKTKASQLPFTNIDGSNLTIDKDFFETKRLIEKNIAGPFNKLEQSAILLLIPLEQ